MTVPLWVVVLPMVFVVGVICYLATHWLVNDVLDPIVRRRLHRNYARQMRGLGCTDEEIEAGWRKIDSKWGQ